MSMNGRQRGKVLAFNSQVGALFQRINTQSDKSILKQLFNLCEMLPITYILLYIIKEINKV